jgi:hypothetical protein
VLDASQFHYGGEVEVPEFRAVVTLNMSGLPHCVISDLMADETATPDLSGNANIQANRVQMSMITRM